MALSHEEQQKVLTGFVARVGCPLGIKGQGELTAFAEGAKAMLLDLAKDITLDGMTKSAEDAANEALEDSTTKGEES